MMAFSKRLTIFEGCDGTGKTTAAKEYASRTGAIYYHFGPLFQVKSGVARMYVEAMLPALLGYQSVVWDRSWLSEVPYGVAFRNGEDRIGFAGRRMLERLAMRCATTVVMCDPGWDAVKASFETGREEMLEDTGQLRKVYDMYRFQRTSLPVERWNYRETSELYISHQSRTSAHSLLAQSAGNLRAKVHLVGEGFGERKNDDAWYQWPFGSFSRQGCSEWLTTELEAFGIDENQLCWWNADMNLTFLRYLLSDDNDPPQILALGSAANAALNELRIKHGLFQHPQYWKRFRGNEPYPLITALRGILNHGKTEISS